ncbi:MAG: hypothetical protein ABI847_07460 [Anaerolineales bacterium]
MLLPDYWLERPNATAHPGSEAAFDALLESTLRAGGCPEIPFTLPSNKWQFLCHVAEHHDIVLHGSGDPNIAVFEPRQSNDLIEFGNQKAVYAASDGIWPIFFAVVDRERYAISVANACVQIADPAGVVHGPYYVFSISRPALARQPWRTGTVYLLPRQTFAAQSPVPFGSNEVRIAQLASTQPVRPLAKITVAPSDFPFLHQIRGHDDQRLQEYAMAMQTGAPWPEDI